MAEATPTSVNHPSPRACKVLGRGRPQSSPYASEPVWLTFGCSMKLHLLPRALLPPSTFIHRPDLDCLIPGQPTIPLVSMKDVDADVAHTFVHYLHTGAYQTLNSPALDGGPPIHPAEASGREHRRALLSYVAATNHELVGLRKLARERAEVICQMLAPWTVLQDVEVAYQNLQERDVWLDGHVKRFFRKCTAVSREGAGRELTRGLKNIFTCSLLDAAIDVFGDVVVQRNGDALEMPTAPDMVSDENESEGSSSELSFDAEVIELDQELEKHGDEPQSPDAVTASIPDSELATVLEMPHGPPSHPPKLRHHPGREARVVNPEREWVNLPPPPPPAPIFLEEQARKAESSSEQTATPHPGSIMESASRQQSQPVFQLPMLPPGIPAPPSEKTKYKKKKKATKRGRVVAGGPPPPLPLPTDGWFPAPPGPQLSHPEPPFLNPFPKARRGPPFPDHLPPPPPPPPPPPGTTGPLCSMPPPPPPPGAPQVQIMTTAPTLPPTPPSPPPMKTRRHRSGPPPPPMPPLPPMLTIPPPPPPMPMPPLMPMRLSMPPPPIDLPYSPTASSAASSSASEGGSDMDYVGRGRRRGGGATCALMSAHLAGKGWRRCDQCKALVMLATQVARGQQDRLEEDEDCEGGSGSGSWSDDEDVGHELGESRVSGGA